MKSEIQTFSAALGGLVGWLWGDANGFLYALLAFVVIDYATGVMCAILKKELSSEIGAKGISKKITIFLLVGVGHLADMYLLGDGGALRTAIICFYIANEGLSIIENAATIGLPIPAKLIKVLQQLDKQDEKTDEKETTK